MQQVLLGERLSLVPFELDHICDRYIEWLNDPDVNQYLEVRFSLVGRLANETIAPVFKHICTTLAESFAERAKELYGERQFA